jgi:predicted DNA-binding transcriptional regulator AlpA
MSEQSLEQLLDEKELALLIRVSIGSLRFWRSERQGPPSIKVGHLVRYRPSDVAAWLRSRTLTGSLPVEVGR